MTQVIVMGALLSSGRIGTPPQPALNPAPAAARIPSTARRPIGGGELFSPDMSRSVAVAEHSYFVQNETMNVDHPDEAVSRIAAAIGEPARARMLYCLADGRARTSTELGVVGRVSPSTASVHLNRLKTERLVNVFAQGKHRYYSLSGTSVADALEALSVVAGHSHRAFVPNTPNRLGRRAPATTTWPGRWRCGSTIGSWR